MEFRLILSCKDFYFAYASEGKVGLEKLDYIRKELGLSIPHDRVDAVIPCLKIDRMCLLLTEEEALASGRFTDSNEFRVSVYENFLNSRIRPSVHVERKNAETGEIERCSIRMKFDADGIVQDWLNDLAPEKWGF